MANATAADVSQPRTKRLPRLLLAFALILVAATAGLWWYGGSYAFHVAFRNGGTYWLPLGTDSALLSPSMRLALAGEPEAVPGELTWQTIGAGFDVADLAAEVAGRAVDHLFLARIDPARFRLVVRNAADGDKGLDQWMAELKPALVVNGSFFSHRGEPDTPFLSDGTPLGPRDYDAKAGAFVASPQFTGIRDLARQSWRDAFRGADDAMVSYPLLIANGSPRVEHASRWLANRSFVGQDQAGRIIIGTTTDAFFSLARLARFLVKAPIGLTIALNLDGGPVASQAISLNGYQRKSYGRWEAQVEGDRVKLLTWPYGSVAMPVVLAVLPK